MYRIVHKYPRQGLARGKSCESIAGGGRDTKKGKRGRESSRLQNVLLLTFLHFSSPSLSLACCSRVRAVCPACLRRKHRSEGLAPRWWKPDITAALAAPLDTLPEQGWVVATHSPQQPLRFMKSQLSFSSARLSFSSTPRISSSLIVLRPFCYWSAGEWSAGDNSNIACGICVWISRNYEFFDR